MSNSVPKMINVDVTDLKTGIGLVTFIRQEPSHDVKSNAFEAAMNDTERELYALEREIMELWDQRFEAATKARGF